MMNVDQKKREQLLWPVKRMNHRKDFVGIRDDYQSYNYGMDGYNMSSPVIVFHFPKSFFHDAAYHQPKHSSFHLWKESLDVIGKTILKILTQ
mmetsp:Transcript_27841/g.67430  ORF Transcript_27841/g.67430 Transcript_27841/m.67430 type:complete len:92 (+) Transcript_27841:1930-2205(+)